MDPVRLFIDEPAFGAVVLGSAALFGACAVAWRMRRDDAQRPTGPPTISHVQLRPRLFDQDEIEQPD